MTKAVQPAEGANEPGPSLQTQCRPLAELGSDSAPSVLGMSGDTSPTAARRYFALLAGLTAARRLEMTAGLSRMTRSLALLGARLRHPDQGAAEHRLRVAEAMYGRLENRFGLDRYDGVIMPDDAFLPQSVALAIGEALDALGIAYFIGGSVASSIQGDPRATNDLDLVAELSESQVAPLALLLGADFSVDEDGLRTAVRTRRSDNIFFLPFLMKVDLFICGSAPYDRMELARRQRFEVEPGRHVWLKSAEDTVLRKLLWFRQGGGVSDSQWRDVTSVLRISGSSMDSGYLDEWASQLGVEDLLARARAEVRQA